MMVRDVSVLLAAFVGGAVALSGCGGWSVGRCVPVQGKVTLGDRPLVGGTVTFIPQESGKTYLPEGTIDAQGQYALRTAGREGAPVGKYRAVVTTSGEDKFQDSQFDPRYSHNEKSPLEEEVTDNAPADAYDLKLEPLRRR